MNCPICNNDKIIKYLDVLKCETCTHMFSKKIDDEEYWNYLYENTYNTIFRKRDEKRNQMYLQEHNWISTFKKFQGSFLDVGCAHGDFFSSLPQNLEKTGIDLSINIIEEAKKLHPDCKFFKNKLCSFSSKDKFDFIQFRGVLQHSIDPINNLKCAIDFLNCDGIILVSSLPDFSSFTSKFYKDKFSFHLPNLSPHLFTLKSFDFMITSLNLKISKQVSPYFGTPYENFSKDCFCFLINKLKNKSNPPFFGNVKNYILQLNTS
jgi:2-polyprenyl-3-methyl-5-hydroxy-6-metoxy-1,4-benzoquinol methylase